MSICFCPVRRRPAKTPSHQRLPRLWAALPEPARLQLARQVARLLRRLSDVEASHADPLE